MVWQVMIVDDDRNFRYALREVIPWEENGFHVAAEAIHGKQALELLKDETVHIVITDMDMPVMNGVELTGEIKRQYPDVIIVACSAFDDFHFVKESMRLGAEDYILKQELDGENVIRVLQNLLKNRWEKREEERKEEENQDILCSYLCGGRKDLPEDSPRFRRLCAEKHMAVFLICNYSHLYGNPRQVEEIEVLEVVSAAGRYLAVIVVVPVFIDQSDALRWYRNAAEKICSIFRGHVQAGFCEQEGDYHTLPESYQKAAEALQTGYLFPKKRVFSASDMRHVVPDSGTGQGSGAESEKEQTPPSMEAFESIDAFCTALEEYFIRYRITKEETEKTLVSILNHDRISSQREDDLVFFERLKEAYLLHDKIAAFQAVLQDRKKRDYAGSHPEIREAVRYVQRHYQEELTLGQVAAKVGLSENYLSNLFKQEMGINFTSYVNRVRIDQAKALLDTTSLKVYEIAERVGFRNTTYFSTTFRKVAGISVSDYKSRK